jgi:small conductance mechanosensitive channel
METSMSEFWQTILPWLIKGGWALAIFFVGRKLSGWISKRFGKFLGKHGLNDLLVKLSVNASYAALLVLVVLAALEQLGINTTSALAVFGAFSLAVGLAVKDSLSNFASGVMIAFFEPFSLGHYVEAGGSSGTVVEVGMFNTILRTPDNKIIIVPNSVVYNGTIVNYSAEETRRVDLVFGIGYEDDYDKACELIRGVIEADERILKEPAPTIAMAELADSSVNINVWPWVNGADYWTVRASLLEKIKAAFDANSISIPFPQQDVHMHQVNG